MIFTHKNSIAFRKLEQKDLESLKSLKDTTWRDTHRVSVLNMTDQQSWFEQLSRSHTNYVFVGYEEVDSAQIVVGPIGIYKVFNIDWINCSADIGYDVFGSFRGKGIGKKLVIAGTSLCFRMLNLRRLTAEILENNIASIKVIESAGFEREGQKRAAVLKDAVLLDSIIYGKLR